MHGYELALPFRRFLGTWQLLCFLGLWGQVISWLVPTFLTAHNIFEVQCQDLSPEVRNNQHIPELLDYLFIFPLGVEE